MCTGASGLMSSNAISSSSSCTRFDGISPATILQNKHDMRASIVRSTRRQSVERQEESGIDALLDSVSQLAVSDLQIVTARGKTIIRGTAKYQLDRERLYDAIKNLEGWESDVLVDVDVERQDVRGYHTVLKGDTLASIAEQYLGSAAREMAVFDANRDRMNDPDQIFPGQQLLIPWQ
jgi:nucleoid-associated protein YgaU